ncbi:MAG: PorV/PorQ family protein [Ignavibacteriales bacterium]|nr:PorV/PorQ family protein [Ignavibacteriales bacterium]
MNKLKLFLIVATISVIFSNLIFADGGNRVGTAGSTQLLIPVGTRGIAMNSTTLTDSRGVEALFWNPANLAREEGTSVTFTHSSYIADIGVDYGALGFNLGKLGSIALSIKSLSIGDIAITTVDNPDGNGQFFQPKFITTGLTYSIMLSDRISVGITTNLNFEKMAEVSKSNVSFNVGISYTNLANINGLALGIVLKNFGIQSSFAGTGLNILSKGEYGYLRQGNNYYTVQAASEELPTTLELGLGYRFAFGKDNALQLNGVFQNSNFNYDEYRVGLEYAFQDMIFLRGGYLFMPGTTDTNAKETTLTGGLGVKFGLGGNLKVLIDYAYQKRVLFNDTHTFGVSLAF